MHSLGFLGDALGWLLGHGVGHHADGPLDHPLSGSTHAGSAGSVGDLLGDVIDLASTDPSAYPDLFNALSPSPHFGGGLNMPDGPAGVEQGSSGYGGSYDPNDFHVSADHTYYLSTSEYVAGVGGYEPESSPE
jgi:hypothetical protein